jgi:hypothetical protein
MADPEPRGVHLRREVFEAIEREARLGRESRDPLIILD